MKNADWIDAGTACALLGVKPQTLYAYVSRKKIRVQVDLADARHRLYARPDIETLARQNHRPRARAEVAEQAIRWGDPVLSTALSEVREGGLWLRGLAVEDCAERMTLEEMAAHLWDVPVAAFPASEGLSAGSEPLVRALAGLTRAVETAGPMQPGQRAVLAAQGRSLLSAMGGALMGGAGGGPMHRRLGRAWGLAPPACEDLRRALVLLSDHELNPSTFAVRVAASTGASLPAALICGLATLSGARHGGVAVQALRALRAARADRVDTFLARAPDPYAFGFGHPLYPDGDPRARHLLARLPRDAPALGAVRALSDRLGLAPNIDAALAALTLAHGLSDAAGFALFATARSAGWVAHAMEQVDSGALIRPRARYAGKV
ncbi:citrate synthase [Pseudooceanicola sp. CBS1P-1]|uniref:Citrate synthase n=1 Tax=Pseudooceanicola albus TaxID=2692189 RepID=A0A6L7G4X9_9RHOB|nr:MULTISPECIES: citrate synthase [Pseudooceanicola]MBT9385140.1 citrate synthase [Pseudooceanicola endophyticus]MXN18568.1 citrate synthase [Pseudooceanicola albus]